MADPRDDVREAVEAIAAEWGWIKTAGLLADLARIAIEEKTGKHTLDLVLHHGKLSDWEVTLRRRKGAA